MTFYFISILSTQSKSKLFGADWKIDEMAEKSQLVLRFWKSNRRKDDGNIKWKFYAYLNISSIYHMDIIIIIIQSDKEIQVQVTINLWKAFPIMLISFYGLKISCIFFYAAFISKTRLT